MFTSSKMNKRDSKKSARINQFFLHPSLNLMYKKGLILLFSCMILTGCFFPNEQRSENRLTYPDQLQAVQQAILQFQTDTGVLPIRTFDETTPLYQRYVIDFNQLVPRYMQDPPGTAFENGGVFQYVLVNVEESPEVKVIDLTTQQEIMKLQQQINQYMNKHTYAPIEEIIDTGLFRLDHKALNYSEAPYVKSPYYDTHLPLLLTNDGEVIIDYRIDLNMMLQEFGHSFTEGEDIRSILYENSSFVPNKSIPYIVDKNGEPEYAMGLQK